MCYLTQIIPSKVLKFCTKNGITSHLFVTSSVLILVGVSIILPLSHCKSHLSCLFLLISCHNPLSELQQLYQDINYIMLSLCRNYQISSYFRIKAKVLTILKVFHARSLIFRYSHHLSLSLSQHYRNIDFKINILIELNLKYT